MSIPSDSRPTIEPLVRHSQFCYDRLVDLTAPLGEKTPSYPTDPPFRMSWHVNFGEQGFCVSKIEMGAHTGTHVDAPSHFLGDSFPDLSRLPLPRFMGEAIALEKPKQAGQDLAVADLAGADIRSGDIVLFRTGWDDCPGLEPALVEELIRRGVKAVGGDMPSIDSPAAIAAGAPAHQLAARAGMPVFEALINLDQVTGQRFYFLGLPLRLEGCEASPIRAVALLPPARHAGLNP
jgi:kynurenine formamidase